MLYFIINTIQIIIYTFHDMNGTVVAFVVGPVLAK